MAIEDLEQIPVQFPTSDQVFAPVTYSIHRDGNSVHIRGMEFIKIRNDRSGIGDIIVTVIGKNECSQRGLHDLVATVEEGKEIQFGPLDTYQFQEGTLAEIQYTESDGSTKLPDDDAPGGHPASIGIQILRLYRNL